MIDAKSLYDTLKNRTPANQLEEKRGALELLRLYQHLAHDNVEIRWVHSEANLADCMTKTGAYGVWEAFMKECKWSIVQDSQCTSTRNRRKVGITGRLESNLEKNWREILEEKYGREEVQEVIEVERRPNEDVYKRYCDLKKKGRGEVSPKLQVNVK